MKRMDRIIAVGNETIEAGVRRGIPREKFVFIPNGVDTEKFLEPHTRKELEQLLGENLEEKKILLSTGRLAAHKGIDWFTENVVPKLPKNVLFVIAGDGERRKNIEKIIAEKNLSEKVRLLGRVNDQDLKILYNTSDIYIKPNIKVPGTMEGFGLVAIEAASAKLPVIAANIEGLKDAIKDGQNGFLIETCDTEGYLRKINELLADEAYCKSFGEKARQFVVENYGWGKISQMYLDEINTVIQKSKIKNQKCN
jgi:phosphatidylinositol alpha-1,6-mannosyltransferase